MRHVSRTDPRIGKRLDWRRNRWGGRRQDGDGERHLVGRPWEGRGPAEAARQRATYTQDWGLTVGDAVTDNPLVRRTDALTANTGGASE